MSPVAIQILITIIGSGALFSFLQFLIQRRDNNNKELNELKKDIEEGLKTHRDWGLEHYDIHSMSIEKLNEAILQLTKNDTEMKEYIQYVGAEIMGLAHDKLVYLTDHYQARGAITLKEKATLDAIYQPYHEGLHGNGDGKTGYEFCMTLPVVSDERAREMDDQLKISKYSRRGSM